MAARARVTRVRAAPRPRPLRAPPHPPPPSSHPLFRQVHGLLPDVPRGRRAQGEDWGLRVGWTGLLSARVHCRRPAALRCPPTCPPTLPPSPQDVNAAVATIKTKRTIQARAGGGGAWAWRCVLWGRGGGQRRGPSSTRPPTPNPPHPPPHLSHTLPHHPPPHPPPALPPHASSWTGAPLGSSAASTTSRRPSCPVATWPRCSARCA